MISKVPATKGVSQSTRKHYARSINLVNAPYKKQKPRDSITFEGSDLMMVKLPHSDTIVIEKNIGGANVRRLLVDNGSSCDILFLKAFLRMGIDPKNLKPWTGMLVRFSSKNVHFTTEYRRMAQSAN